MNDISKNSKEMVAQVGGSFKDISRITLRGIVEWYAVVIKVLLEEKDEEIALREEMAGWESIGKRERRIVTLFGVEIRYKRRGYRRKDEGEDGIPLSFRSVVKNSF
ncbi:hypothetical protein V3F56_12360 [Moorellaceae bacterium AZ2]